MGNTYFKIVFSLDQWFRRSCLLKIFELGSEKMVLRHSSNYYIRDI